MPWVLAVRTDDLLAHRESIALQDLNGLSHIELPERSTSRVQLERQLERHGVRLSSTASVADWDTALLLAELGLGHAVLPALPGWTYGPGSIIRLIPIPELEPLVAGWAARRWDALSPLAIEFAETILSHLTARAHPVGGSP
jgi:DNA-binding transcriptional LysR family regulator